MLLTDAKAVAVQLDEAAWDSLKSHLLLGKQSWQSVFVFTQYADVQRNRPGVASESVNIVRRRLEKYLTISRYPPPARDPRFAETSPGEAYNRSRLPGRLLLEIQEGISMHSQKFRRPPVH